MSKQTALVVCPGRGTYNAAELGYLHKHHLGQNNPHKEDFVTAIDAMRESLGQKSIRELDQASKFSLARHASSLNASPLIYACAMMDFMDIDRDKYDIVGICGNSMGWYLSLAASGALSIENGAQLVNAMGGIMQDSSQNGPLGKNGQIVYPIVNEQWQIDEGRVALVEKMISDSYDSQIQKESPFHIYKSIQLGGMVVFGADEAGLAYLMENLPADDRYPMQLANHAGFHTTLLDHILDLATDNIPRDIFRTPTIPLIDGRGAIWQSGKGCDLTGLYDYTLGYQINRTYDFSKSIEMGLKEFAPDKVIILGPGSTLGAPVAQVMIEQNWPIFDEQDQTQYVTNKQDFKQAQQNDPFVIAMGIEEQRKYAI